jgi:prepilin-type N-terminal cleavage/methylation domain-containing protein
MKRIASAQGFTLIEMIVSLAIFSIVATVAVGALLMLVGTNDRLQGEQAITSNISFALDSMVREIRTGSKFYCHSATSVTSSFNRIFNPAHNIDTILSATAVSSCENGANSGHRYHGVAFVEGGDSVSGSGRRILYYFDDQDNILYRRTGANAPQPVLSSEVAIEAFDMFVSATGDGDVRQTSITIYIKATESGLGTDKPFYFQTTIIPRTLGV